MTVFLLYCFLFVAGVIRYWDGCRRLKRAPDMAADMRYQQIPDSDVVAWWHKLTQLDQKFGVFFKRYGLFLIVISLFNLLLILEEVEIPINDFTFGFSCCMTILILLGFLTIGHNSTGSRNGGEERFSLAFKVQRDFVWKYYEIQNFQPMALWTKDAIDKYSDIHVLYRHKAEVNSLLNGPKWLKSGVILYYGAWLIIIVMTTIYHLYSLF